jgi:hypothetical protein
MRRLNVKGWIKPKQKCNTEVKVECAMWNKQIDGLITNHNAAPLPGQEWKQVLDVKEMESSSNMYLKDVSWWKSIKDACKPKVSITVKLSKKGAFS